MKLHDSTNELTQVLDHGNLIYRWIVGFISSPEIITRLLYLDLLCDHNNQDNSQQDVTFATKKNRMKNEFALKSIIVYCTCKDQMLRKIISGKDWEYDIY